MAYQISWIIKFQNSTEEQYCCYFRDQFYTFSWDFSSKVNVIALSEFELTSHDTAVQHVN